MTTPVPISMLYLVADMLLIIMSISGIYTGWQIVKHKKTILWWPQRFGFFIRKLLFGTDNFNKMYNDFISPKNMKQYGMYALTGGCSSLLICFLWLISILSHIF
jgi:hypothetical protein